MSPFKMKSQSISITDIIKIFDSLCWLLVMAIEPSNMLLFSSELIDHVITILTTCFFIMVGKKLTAPFYVHWTERKKHLKLWICVE